MSEINDRILISQKKLTVLLGGLAIAMPTILYLGNLFVFGIKDPMTSLSAYYYSDMRDVFVGIIFSMGIFLISYEGYDNKDRLLADIAAVFAFITALVPTNPPETEAELYSLVHTYSAAIFYGILTIFCLLRFTKSGDTKSTKKKIRNVIYYICGLIMVVVLVSLTATTVLVEDIPIKNFTFWMEYAANTAFGTAFLVKGEGIFFLNDDPIIDWNPWEISGLIILVLLFIGSTMMLGAILFL